MTAELSRRPPAIMLGVPIDDLTMEEAIETVGHMIDSGRRSGRTHQIATVNVDFVVNAIDSESVLRLLQSADICLADGAPIVWGARWAGMPIRERIAGADLVPALAERGVTEGWRMHLFGSATGTAERAADLLKQRFPGALVTGNSGPMLSDVSNVDEDVLESIRAAEADILCVALGNPKQERFIQTYRERLGTPVLIGVGGTLDFIVGGRRRAPRWAQRAGLEWVFRAAQEPRRLGKRYARDAVVFFPRLVRYLRTLRPYRTGADVLCLEILGNNVLVTARGEGHDTRAWRDTVEVMHREGSSLTLDLRAGRHLSMPAVCELVGLLRVARCGAVRLDVSEVSPALARQLGAIGLAAHLIDLETVASEEPG